MGSLEIFGALKEAGVYDGNLFRPMNYRMALLLIGPDSNDLERFVASSVRHALKHTESLISMMSGLTVDSLLGPEGSSFRIGLQRAFRVADFLDHGSPTVAEELEGTQQYLRDAVIEEAARLHQELADLRQTAAARLEAFPERLAKHRSLAEAAIAQGVLCGDDHRDTYFDDAIARLSEIVEQPVGTRDAFTWLLYGWAISLRDGITHESLNALSHAGLTSSAVNDSIFRETHRLIAHAQSQIGSADNAYQSISKAAAKGASSETQLELARYSAGSHRKAEAQQAFLASVAAQPFNLFSVFVDQDMFARANEWLPNITALDRLFAEQASQSLKDWGSLLTALARIEEESTVEVEFDASFGIRHNNYLMQLPSAAIFESASIRAESVRLNAETMNSANDLVGALHRDASDAVQNASGNIEALRLWKRDASESIQSQQQSIKHRARIDLGLYQGGAEKAQTGCMFSLGAGCLGYSFYFTLSVVWASFAAWGGPNTQTGKFILAGLSLPLVIGALMALIEGGRRLKAQAELNRKCHQVDTQSTAALEEITRQYEAKMPALQEALDEAKATVAVTSTLVSRVKELGKQQKLAA